MTESLPATAVVRVALVSFDPSLRAEVDALNTRQAEMAHALRRAAYETRFINDPEVFEDPSQGWASCRRLMCGNVRRPPSGPVTTSFDTISADQGTATVARICCW